jgi:hypothetical protein
MLSIGKKAAIAAALFWSCASVPASAATISNTYSGASYSNIAQFDPSLGTLNAITVDVFNGDARYHIKLDNFFEGPVSYSATAYFGVYLGPLYADGSLSGSGTANFEDAEADIVLSITPYSVNIPVPTDPSSFEYLTLIGTGTFAGSLTVDLPTDLVLGDHAGTNITEVSIVDRYAAFDLIYSYTPFGSSVPEPSSWVMMLAGLALTAGALRNRPRFAPAAYH